MQHADTQADLRRRVALIQVRASCHHRDVELAQFAEDQLAQVPDGRGDGPAGNLGVGNGDGVGEFVGERTESAAQHDGDARLAPGHVANMGDRFVHFLSRSGYSSMPAMHADMKLAMVPAATAFKPSRARSDLRFGASAPMPPI